MFRPGLGLLLLLKLLLTPPPLLSGLTTGAPNLLALLPRPAAAVAEPGLLPTAPRSLLCGSSLLPMLTDPVCSSELAPTATPAATPVSCASRCCC
jgi:hypothetical protein